MEKHLMLKRRGIKGGHEAAETALWSSTEKKTKAKIVIQSFTFL